jgi:hypothetical protein
MELKVAPPPPPPPPPPTYDITGLTEDEALFLRDLCGQFSCVPSVGTPSHMHSALFAKLSGLTKYIDTRYTFEVTNVYRKRPVLRCHRRDPGEDD